METDVGELLLMSGKILLSGPLIAHIERYIA